MFSPQAFILDMDGVLWHSDQPLPGLHTFFATVRRLGLAFVLATNNASQTPAQYVSKLARLGVTVHPHEILGSAEATALVMARHLPPGTRVFAIGEAGLREALSAHHFVLTDLYEPATVVACGMDRQLSWDKLATATLALRAGAHFFGTNPDLSVPTARGITHGNGAVLAALQAASGRTPTIIGKPEPTMYQLALERLSTPPAATWAVGDRLDTDILGAHRAGLPSVLVFSGVTTPAEAAAAAIHPTRTARDLAEIADWLNDVPR